MHFSPRHEFTPPRSMKKSPTGKRVAKRAKASGSIRNVKAEMELAKLRILRAEAGLIELKLKEAKAGSGFDDIGTRWRSAIS